MNNPVCIITEKPSVANDIAKVLNVTHRGDGYLYNDQYKITWAYGHLVALADPQTYGFTSYAREELPMLPKPFKLVVRQVKKKDGKGYEEDSFARKQLDVIKQCFDSSERIIVATDAGREGELIFRYIYYYLGCSKPFDRLWLSSMTDQAIRDAFTKLKEGQLYDNLYLAGKARSEADWLVGMNSSRALTIASNGGGGLSLGRVQTPTLCMICDRYLSNKNFVKSPFWKINAQVKSSDATFTVSSPEPITNKGLADSKLYAVSSLTSLTVTKAERKSTSTQPPLLYDLTTLQKEANKQGFTAEQTLNIAQSLYEKKVTTYPRTGSRYIPKDVYDTMSYLLRQLPYQEYQIYAQGLIVAGLNTRSVDDSKITDHHAIITTGETADLTEDEAIIYKMIAMRMLEAVSPASNKDLLSLTLSGGGEELVTTLSCITKKGWRVVKDDPADDPDSEEISLNSLPSIVEGMELSLVQATLKEGETKPKPIYTEATLLGAMERAGKEIEDKEAREAMQDVGLGTPATRASIIEKLLRQNYAVRQKNQLIPTERGLAVYDLVKSRLIGNAELTGQWEKSLAEIETGNLPPTTFNAQIEDYTKQITDELLSTSVSLGTNYICPLCHQESVRIYSKSMRCQNDGCQFSVWRTVAGVPLTEEHCKQLLSNGKTSLLKGLTSKAGKTFSAYLVLDHDTGKTSFEFPSNSRKNK